MPSRRSFPSHVRVFSDLRYVGNRYQSHVAPATVTTTAAAAVPFGGASAALDADYDVIASAFAPASTAGNEALGIDVFVSFDGLRPTSLDRVLLQEKRMRQIYSLFQPRIPP